MSKKLLYLLGIIVTLGLATYAQVKYKCSNCEEPTEVSEETEGDADQQIRVNGFSFSKNGVGFICNDNFQFEKNGFNAKQPIGDSIDLGITDLKSYLDNNPNDKARITGICKNDEDNTSAFPNLGFARANNVKNYLISKGIPANRLAITGSRVEDWDDHENTVWGPINIDFVANTQDNAVDYAAVKSRLNSNPLHLEFNSGEAAINLSEDQRKMITDITMYLDNVPGSKISIEGHTDNLGSREANIALGMERAEFAKAYLVKNGVNADRIDVSSEGPDKPIADNSLESGRKKNRRTVVLLK